MKKDPFASSVQSSWWGGPGSLHMPIHWWPTDLWPHQSAALCWAHDLAGWSHWSLDGLQLTVLGPIEDQSNLAQLFTSAQSSCRWSSCTIWFHHTTGWSCS